VHPIKVYRRARRLSQDRLAVLAGISQAHLGYLERGARPVSDAVARKLARVLGVRVAALRSGAAR
jgi:transcriptional regulator with XRE-family HTH domain